jgi:hypothetical protein
VKLNRNQLSSTTFFGHSAIPLASYLDSSGLKGSTLIQEKVNYHFFIIDYYNYDSSDYDINGYDINDYDINDYNSSDYDINDYHINDINDYNINDYDINLVRSKEKEDQEMV